MQKPGLIDFSISHVHNSYKAGFLRDVSFAPLYGNTSKANVRAAFPHYMLAWRPGQRLRRPRHVAATAQDRRPTPGRPQVGDAQLPARVREL